MNLDQMMETTFTQAPLAGAAIYVARLYMQKHEQMVNKLIGTFEAEVKSCEDRFNRLFDELGKR